ncbi:protein MODIFYING WALL LIGNIN-2-like [Euphorbia lathyris]|uniref:protein MODIFYING WALL LIGNIN-2-like n=1 Tax=Euphorbia lathyris TaxID=212925 RepID=UPI003313D97C
MKCLLQIIRKQMKERHQCGFLLILFLILSLGLVSFISCLLAESSKAKKEDVKLDNKECFVGESRAFWYGVSGILCLIVAQFIGNLVICCNFWTRNYKDPNTSKRPKLPIALWVLSWMSFGVGVIILSGATSMSRKQEYGKGWLEQDCYLVKDGIFIASAFLVLLTIATSTPILTKSQPTLF